MNRFSTPKNGDIFFSAKINAMCKMQHSKKGWLIKFLKIKLEGR